MGSGEHVRWNKDYAGNVVMHDHATPSSKPAREAVAEAADDDAAAADDAHSRRLAGAYGGARYGGLLAGMKRSRGDAETADDAAVAEAADDDAAAAVDPQS